MPKSEPFKNRKTNGRLVVVALLALAVLASLGTCARFSSDNPLALEIRFTGGDRLLATFSEKTAQTIRPGMKATLTFAGRKDRFAGWVQDVSGQEVLLTFPGGLAGASETAARLTVDTSIPPDSVSPETQPP